MKINYLLVTVVFVVFPILFNSTLYSQEHQIILDEEYTDWNQISGVSDTSETISGEAFLPDWDSTYFADTKLNTTHMQAN